MMQNLKNLFKPRKVLLTLSKSQKELLELLMMNKADYDGWAEKITSSKIRPQFFYPSAIDFYFDEFKLFTAFFKKNRKGEIELQEMKMTETNYDSIRCYSWMPFEEAVLEFLTSLEENKKIALFEKRKTLFEYQSLCAKNEGVHKQEAEYAKAVSASPLQVWKPTQ